MKEYRYTVIIEPADEGGYLAHVPALNHLTTEGETLEEIEMNVREAIQGYLETAKQENIAIPQDIKEQPRVRQFAVSM